MRTSVPSLLPLFRSPMQVQMLGLLLLQPERTWTLSELAETLDAPRSSVHRELNRAVTAGIVQRNAGHQPHGFSGATANPSFEPLAAVLRATVGVESALKEVLDRPDVDASLIHGSWARGAIDPDSDIDVLVVGTASPSELRRAVRPVSRAVRRPIDVTAFTPSEYEALVERGASFVRKLLAGPSIPLTGNLTDASTNA